MHVLDRAVLARGVHALQHDEHCTPVLGHQHRGELGHALGALGGLRAGHGLVLEAELGARLVLAEIDLGAGGDARCLHEILHRADLMRTRAGEAGNYPSGATSSMRFPKGSSTNARTMPGSGDVRPRRTPGGVETRDECGEARGIAQPQRGVGLRRGRERLSDADVQLLAPAREPAAAARRQHGGLLDLCEAEQPAVERTRGILATGRRRHLDVVDPGDGPVTHAPPHV